MGWMVKKTPMWPRQWKVYNPNQRDCNLPSNYFDNECDAKEEAAKRDIRHLEHLANEADNG